MTTREATVYTVDQVRNIYSRTARYYDGANRLFTLIGAPIKRYRREAVAALGLNAGDTVLELGCGTGANFEMLERGIGAEGRIIGVDLTDEMLDVARRRVQHEGWRNVELVQSDIGVYTPPGELTAVLTTFALTLSPEFDAVIARVAESLAPGGRFALLDLKRPDGWPEPLVRLAAWLNRPFAVTRDLGDRDVRASARSRLQEVLFGEYYRGAIYLSVSERPT